jgi:hypothetical protein
MKVFLISHFLLVLSTTSLYAQEDSVSLEDKIITNNNYPYFPLIDVDETFWGGIDGLFLSIDNRYELKTYGLGFQVKAWAMYPQLPLVSFSYYLGYRYLFDFQKLDNTINHCFSTGIQFSIIGLETNIYFGKHDQFLWNIMPKIGVDFGYLSLFYGYGLPIIKQDRQILE